MDPRNPQGGYGASAPLGDRQPPFPAPESSRPANKRMFQDFAVTGTPFQRAPLTEVWTLLPVGNNIAMFRRDRPLDIVINAQGSIQGGTDLRVYFQHPTAVFWITGTAVASGDGADAIVGDPRDQFTVEYQRASQAERFLTGPALGSTVTGTGQRPYRLAPNGWLFNSGESLIVTLTPLRPDMRITLNFGTAEIHGPANFTWGTIPAVP